VLEEQFGASCPDHGCGSVVHTAFGIGPDTRPGDPWREAKAPSRGRPSVVPGAAVAPVG
jgi:hypothetical protein